MKVDIHITISEEDIQAGLTAQDVVNRAFPTAPDVRISGSGFNPSTAAAADVEAPDVGLTEPEEDVPDAPSAESAPPTSVHSEPVSINSEQDPEVDSAGVPWSADLHSSNRKKYDNGRWMWKRGSDKDTREQEALALAVPIKSEAPSNSGELSAAAPGLGSSAGTGAPTPDNAAPAGFPQPDNSAPGTANAPTPENSGGETSQSKTTGPLTWPDFLKAVKANGKTMADVNEALGQVGLEQVAMLSPGVTNEKRDQVAAILGLV